MTLVMTAYGLVKTVLYLIGLSTAPEDVTVLGREKLPAIVRWFLDTPEWSGPIVLAIGFGIAIWLLWPDAAQSRASATIAATPLPDIPERREPTLSYSPPEPLEAEPAAPTMAAPIGGLLGAPIGAIPTIALPPPAPRIDPELEHVDKRKAKEAIVPLTSDYFHPAFNHLHTFKCEARDRFLSQFAHNGAVKSVCIRAIDHAPEKPPSRKDYASVNELRSIDKVRSLNLYETETALYHAYIDYGETVRLAVDLVNECDPMHESVVKILRDMYTEWRSAHDQFVERQLALRTTHLDFNTVGRLHLNVLQKIPEPNWESATIPKA